MMARGRTGRSLAIGFLLGGLLWPRGASADDAPPTPTPTPAPLPAGPEAGSIPDASFFAMLDRKVEIQTSDGARWEGRLVRVDVRTVTVVVAGTRDVITLHRAVVTRLRASEDAAPQAAPAAPAPAASPPPDAPKPGPKEDDRERNVAVSFGVLPSISLDGDWGLFHAFANWDFLASFFTTSDHTVFAGGAGAGITLPAFPGSRWRFDVVGTAHTLVVTGEQWWLGLGTAFGVHYTFSSGFTVGTKVPGLGLSASNKKMSLAESAGLFYATGLAGLPLLSLGYRF